MKTSGCSCIVCYQCANDNCTDDFDYDMESFVSNCSDSYNFCIVCIRILNYKIY